MTTKGKQQQFLTFKAIFICCLLFFLMFLIIRSKIIVIPIPNSQQTSTTIQEPTQTITNANANANAYACTKIPPYVAHALIKYVTSSITPQQTIQEISLSLNVIANKSPCNFLVFGIGFDSLMWAALNHGGRTVFLEDDKNWLKHVTKENPSLESYHVQYHTNISQAEHLHHAGTQQPCRVVTDPRLSECELVLKGMPNTIYDTEWDLIMVDAPKGYSDAKAGRMGAIYTAGLMARNREKGETHVFVHDVDRMVEDKFSKTFLCEEHLVEEFGILRHFIVPSHKSPSSSSSSSSSSERGMMPFCP